MLRQNQNQRQMQTQKLSPQQIQLMKLLQVPTLLLNQRIEEELEENPALEDTGNEELEEREESEEEFFASDAEEESKKEEDGFDEPEEAFEEPSLDDYLEDYLSDDTPEYRLNANLQSADIDDKDNPSASEQSFHEYLEDQISLLQLDGKERKIAEQIIGTIEPSGYLQREVADISDDLAFGRDLLVAPEEVEAVLKKIQSLDPPGIAARNLRECLYIQLERKLQSEEIREHYDDEEFEALQLAFTIISDYFDEFSKKHYKKLLRQLNVDEDQLRAASEEINRLNPKPGSVYAPASPRRRQQHAIVPDFLVEAKNGELELELNSRNAPELRISRHYKEMFETYSHNKKDKKQKEALLFVKQKIDSARWFIDAIKQRHQTMYKCMSAILLHQKEYFLTGDEKKIRPMILKDIAEITGLDISTVSRVANSKYVQTEFGTSLLKDLFSESLQTDSGEEVSTLEVKKILSEMIEGENKRRPYSDEKIKDRLQSLGYNIARRTVAKYREQLNIPVARLRKEI